MVHLSDDEVRRIAALLAPDEAVLWAATSVRPAPGLGGLAWVGLVFAVLFSGLAGLLLWAWDPADSTGRLTVGLMTVAGLACMSGALAAIVASRRAARTARRTACLVTSKRALIARPNGGTFRLTTFAPAAFEAMDLALDPDGVGTIRFARTTPPASRQAIPVSEIWAPEPAFVGVPDARVAYELLRRLADGPLPTPLVDALTSQPGLRSAADGDPADETTAVGQRETARLR